MLVKLKGIGEDVMTDLPVGHHVLGRSEFLKCYDKRVSRAHVSLKIGKDNVALSVIHVNPCYFMSGDTKAISILKQDQPQILKSGDRFGFLPDKHWFEVLVLPDQNLTSSTAKDNNINVNETPDKKIVGDSNINEDVKKRAYDGDSEAESTAKKTKHEETTEPMKEQTSADGDKNDKKEDDPEAGTSEQKKKVRRDRCWYGAGCYRKNSDHRRGLSHPGDSDFDSDPDDDRPDCKYGSACYRKNKQHRLDFKHPLKPPSKLIKKRRAAALKANYKDDTPEDDYDLNDPFIDDDDSDEYSDDSAHDDTDWEDSQDHDADEDIKRLLKDAKHFMNNF